MNILITGATGFIGRHLTEKLSEFKEHNIFCLARNLDKAKVLERLGVKLIYADITQKFSLNKVFNYKIEVIFHCAGLVENKNPDLLYKVNVIGTENICELAMKLRVERVVYLSSVSVISGNLQVPLREDLPFMATNAYGRSKIEAEKKVLEYRRKGLKTVIIRPCMVYGEDEPHMMKFLLFLLKYRLLPLLNKGKNKFHLVYVRNVVEAMIFSLGKVEFLKGVFFIADKEVFTAKEVFAIFSGAIGAKIPLNAPGFLMLILLKLPYLGRRMSFFLKDRVYSIKQIESLGFSPPYSAKESLVKSAQTLYYRNN